MDIADIEVKPWVHTAHDRNSIHEADFMLFTHGDIIYYQGDLFLGREGVSSIRQVPMLELAKTKVALILDRKLFQEAGLEIPANLDFYINEIDVVVMECATMRAEKYSKELDR